jgi:hypothetical protein
MVYEGFHPTEFASRGQTFSRNNMSGNVIAGYMAFSTMGHTLIAIGLGFVGGRFAQRLALAVSPPKYRSIEEILQEVETQ